MRAAGKGDLQLIRGIVSQLAQNSDQRQGGVTSSSIGVSAELEHAGQDVWMPEKGPGNPLHPGLPGATRERFEVKGDGFLRGIAERTQGEQRDTCLRRDLGDTGSFHVEDRVELLDAGWEGL